MLLLIAVPLILAGLGGGAQAGELRLLHREGELLSGEDEQPVPEEERAFPAGTLLRAGPAPPAGQLEKRLGEPPTSTAALLIAPGQVVTLSTGASLRTDRDGEDRLDLILSGAVHILLAAPEEGQAVNLALGELTLETSRAHLFYNGWARPARLIVVSGEVKLTGIVAVIPGPEGAKDPSAALKEGDALALHPDAPALEEPTENDERLRRWPELPGFQVPGPYKRVGGALPSDERLAVVRYGREAVLSGQASMRAGASPPSKATPQSKLSLPRRSPHQPQRAFESKAPTV